MEAVSGTPPPSAPAAEVIVGTEVSRPTTAEALRATAEPFAGPLEPLRGPDRPRSGTRASCGGPTPARAGKLVAQNLKTVPSTSFPQALEETMRPSSLYRVAVLAAGCRGFLGEPAPRPLAAASDSVEYAEFAGTGAAALQGQNHSAEVGG